MVSDTEPSTPYSLPNRLPHAHYFSSPHPDQLGTHPCLDIVLDEECLILVGTGSDVVPARLSGHLYLYLADSGDVKEIKMTLKGKARVPALGQDS